MAKHMFYNASVTVNSVDLSDHCESVELPNAIKELAASAMGDGQEYNIPGLRSVGPIKITFYQDYAASKVYATIQPLWTASTIFNLVLKADAGATAATNPQFTISCFVKDAPFLGGKHGDRHMMTASFSPAGVLAIATS